MWANLHTNLNPVKSFRIFCTSEMSVSLTRVYFIEIFFSYIQLPVTDQNEETEGEYGT